MDKKEVMEFLKKKSKIVHLWNDETMTESEEIIVVKLSDAILGLELLAIALERDTA